MSLWLQNKASFRLEDMGAHEDNKRDSPQVVIDYWRNKNLGDLLAFQVINALLKEKKTGSSEL